MSELLDAIFKADKKMVDEKKDVIKMSYFVYWCVECGKSFREIDLPTKCDECGGDLDHDERED